MNITRDNYEAWFLDYHEGTLTESQMAELLDFLVLNPDLAEEFKSFDIIGLEADTDTVFAQKDYLKKPFDASLTDEVEEKHLIAWYEGDLTDAEKSKVNQAIAGNPEMRRNFSLYGLSRLQPETTVVYPNKQELKKYVLGGYTTYIRQFAAAAAVVVFIATIYFMIPDISNSGDVAVTTPEETVNQKQPDDQQQQSVIAESPIETTDVNTESVISRPKTPSKRQPQPSYTNPPVQLAQITPVTRTTISGASQKPEAIETRTEFFWLTYADGMYFDEEEDEEMTQPVPQSRYVSLANLAFEGIEKRTGFSIDDAVAQASNLKFWDIAEMGLAGLGQITGTSLTVERETDETGRVRLLGIGDRFKIRR
jgi:hypothetical protein